MIDFLLIVVKYFDSVQYCTVISPENTQYTSLYIYKKIRYTVETRVIVIKKS